LVAASVLGLLVLLPLEATPASSGSELLPDLVADAPTNPLLGVYSYGGNSHLLLRFDGYIHNRGVGPVEIRGATPNGASMTSVSQRIYREDGSHADELSGAAEVLFEPADGHDHWHLKNAARYSLWDPNGIAEVAPSMKVGFCLGDVQRMDPWAPASAHYTLNSNGFCEQHNPTALSVSEGISAGWRDTYSRALAFQWVDVSDVQPGDYRLGAAVDPNDIVRESDEANDATTLAAAISTVPGYRALPVTLGAVPKDRSRKIKLPVSTFGAPGAPRFQIESAPQHGTLDRQVGVGFDTKTVIYTPEPGYEGSDSFSFSVRDSTSNYPVHPATAAVSLALAQLTPAVAISGAPQSLLAGTSAQLTASVSGDTPDITWSVNGMPGGSDSAGTILDSGLYVAPAQPPPGSVATIRAETDSGAYAETPITIAVPPTPQPAPTPAAINKLGKSLLARPSIARSGDMLVIGVTAARAGVIRISLFKRGSALGFCKTRAPAHQVVTCRVRLKPGTRARGARIVVSLRSGGRLLALRKRQL
jgi:hypothetical protein